MAPKKDDLEALFGSEYKPGSTVLVEFEGLLVPCRVLGSKRAYGHTRYDVEPVGGRGRKTINSDRVRAR